MGASTMCSSSSTVDVWSVWNDPTIEPQASVPTTGLFDVEVMAANVVRLIPRTDLARSIAAMMLGGTIRPHLEYRCAANATSEGAHGAGITALVFTHEMTPVLSNGADPYWNGMAVTKEEADACRAYLERRRAAARRPAKKAGRK
jgi:hypothetical protein